VVHILDGFETDHLPKFPESQDVKQTIFPDFPNLRKEKDLVVPVRIVVFGE